MCSRPPSSRSTRRPQAATSPGSPGKQTALGGGAAADPAPLLAGGAAEAGRNRCDWRGPQPEGAEPLYQRSLSRGAGSLAAGVRRRGRDSESRWASGLARGWQEGAAAAGRRTRVCKAAASRGPALLRPGLGLICGEAAAPLTPKRRRLWRQPRPQPCCAM